MKTTFTLLFVLVSLSAFTQSSTLIVPNGNNGIFSKNNQAVMFNPGTVQLPASGMGTRLMWIPAKSAFRAGTVDGTHWNADSIGVWSTAFGMKTIASGDASTAMGYGAAARGGYSTALGNGTIASGEASTAMGWGTIAGGYYSTAMGLMTNAAGFYSTAFGNATTASGAASTAMGENSIAGGFYSTAMGGNTNAAGSYSTAMGAATTAGGEASTAMGLVTNASGNYSTAMGYFTTAQSYASLVMGQYNIIGGTANSWVNTDPLFVIGNGIDDTNPSNAVTVLKNGRVGIGTPSPDAPLHITGAGAVDKSQSLRAYFDASTGTSIVNDTDVTNDIKVHADGWFWADGGGFVATSDARIKHIIGQSNSAEDLDKLTQIAVTDYTYIDQVNHGNTPQKKVIAQQVKQIFPGAVSQNKGFIPNLYQTAQQVSVEGNTTRIVTEKAYDLLSGDVLKVMVENESEKILEVTVVDTHTFTVAEVLNGRVFVYGKQVEDLHHVDYDAIAMLNVSATQELTKQIQTLKQKNQELEAKNERLEAKVGQIDTQMADLKNLLLKTQPQTLQVAENKP